VTSSTWLLDSLGSHLVRTPDTLRFQQSRDAAAVFAPELWRRESMTPDLSPSGSPLIAVVQSSQRIATVPNMLGWFTQRRCVTFSRILGKSGGFTVCKARTRRTSGRHGGQDEAALACVAVAFILWVHPFRLRISPSQITRLSGGSGDGARVRHRNNWYVDWTHVAPGSYFHDRECPAKLFVRSAAFWERAPVRGRSRSTA